MSKLAVHVQHFKKNAVSGIANHNFYKRGKCDNHSNQDIDTDRSHLNLALVIPEKSLYQDVKNDINRVTGRVTENSVWVSEHIVYPPENLPNEKLEKYFRDVLEFYRKKYGENNIKMMVVHLDETTPHAHIDTVPITMDNRLSRKDIYTRKNLSNLHTELSDFLRERGWDIQRGETSKNKQIRSLTVPDYKKYAETMKIELQGEISDLRDTLQLIHDYDEYRNDFDSINQNMDLLESTISKLPDVKRLFRATQANEWMERMYQIIRDIRRMIDAEIVRLRIFEHQNDFSGEKLSESATQRANTIDEQIRAASHKTNNPEKNKRKEMVR